MPEEGAVAEAAPPELTPEMVSAAMDGKDLPTPEATPPAEAPKPEALTADTVKQMVAELLKAQLSEQLTPLRREYGAAAKLKAQMESLLKQQQQTPKQNGVYESLDPQSQAQYAELVKAVIEREYGERFQKYDSTMEGVERERNMTRAVSRAQEYAGNDFPKLNPILGQLYTQYAKAAAEGDPDAQAMVEGMDAASPIAVKAMMAEAREHYQKSLQAQEEKAKGEKAQAAKRAGTTLSSAPKGQEGPSTDADIISALDKSGKSPGEIAAELRKILEQRGKKFSD